MRLLRTSVSKFSPGMEMISCLNRKPSTGREEGKTDFRDILYNSSR
jgi:hypothetical protein